MALGLTRRRRRICACSNFPSHGAMERGGARDASVTMSDADTRQTTTLPTWRECSDKDDADVFRLTALERFIYDQEPAGEAGEEWREQLQAVISEAVSNARA